MLALPLIGGGLALAPAAQAACLRPTAAGCPDGRQVQLATAAITDGVSNTVAFEEFLVPVGPPPGNPAGAGTNGCGNNSGQNACIVAPFPQPTPTPTPTPTPPAPPPAPPVNPCIGQDTNGDGRVNGKDEGAVCDTGDGSPTVPEPAPRSDTPVQVGEPTSPVVQPPPAVADQVEPIVVPAQPAEAKAPEVGVAVGEVAVVEIAGVPKRMPWTAKIKVGKKWYQIGEWKRTSAKGTALYPAFAAYKPGWYQIKAENRQGKCWWVRLKVY